MKKNISYRENNSFCSFLCNQLNINAFLILCLHIY